MALYCYDLETYPNYFLAMFQDVKTDEFFSFTHDHLPELISWMENPARQFISWNGAYFDDLIIRHIRRKLTPTQSGIRTKEEEGMTLRETKIQDLEKMKHIIDKMLDLYKNDDFPWED